MACAWKGWRDFISVFIIFFLRLAGSGARISSLGEGQEQGRDGGVQGASLCLRLSALSPLCPTRDLTSGIRQIFWCSWSDESAAEQVSKDVVKQEGLPCCESSAGSPNSGSSFLQASAFGGENTLSLNQLLNSPS